VCWSLTDVDNCLGADVLAAIDQAIDDGVDLISVSAGGQTSTNPQQIFTDPVSIGAFHALSRNILLVASAGNDGPIPGTVVNVAPWVFTVAANTLDRDFSSNITVGNKSITVSSLLTILIFSFLFFFFKNSFHYYTIDFNHLFFYSYFLYYREPVFL
jgi:hypothetical protein